jgi:type II secretory pathway pseudopilin PulG
MNWSSENSFAAFVCRYPLRTAQSLPRAQRRDTIGDAKENAFSLVETVAALLILAFISSSVLVVINRYMVSAVDSVLRMQAFEVARTNMEKLLTLTSVQESVEYGTSEMYPDIQYQIVVEPFYEPITAEMWIQAVCSAEYTDSEGRIQTVELTHWLTDVTKAELLKILAQRESELAGEVIETLEEAAEYAGVDEQTIEEWVDNGMLLTEEGYYVMSQLELYKETDGNPTIEDKRRLYPDKVVPTDKQTEPSASRGPGAPRGEDKPFQQSPPGGDSISGYPREVLEQMPLDELIKLFFGDK